MVAIVELAAGLPFASVTLEPPLDVVAALVACLAWRRWHGRDGGTAATGSTAPPPPAPAVGSRRRDARGTAPPRRRPPAVGRTARRVGALALVVAARRRRGRRARPPARRPGDRPRRRAGRRDPRRGLARRPPARRRRAGSGPPARRARSAAPAVGSPDRRRRPDAPARGPRRRARPAARALPRRPVFEPGMLGPGPGYAAWARRLACRRRPARPGLAAGDRLAVDDIRLRVLWPIRGSVPSSRPTAAPGSTTSRSSCSARSAEPPVPAHGRRRGGDRPRAPGRGPAARRPAQGRPPRQPDRDHRSVPRGGSTRRSPWRRPAPATRTGIPARRRSTARGGRCPRLSDGPRRHRRRHLRGEPR